LKMNW